MSLALWIVIFVVALVVLIKSADYFTDYSERLGKIVGVPQFIIGVTIVALGTSLPELMTGGIATLRGDSSVVAANVVGSNIANLMLVGGVAAMMARTLTVEKSLIRLDLPLLVGTTALLIATLWDGSFTVIEGAIMLVAYVIYVAYNYYEHANNKVEKLGDVLEKKEKLTPKIPLIIGLSAVGIYFGADYTIQALQEISAYLNIAPSVIAVTAIALGTSLPELLVSYKAVKAKNYELVLGNILGSNIFNATIVMGLPSIVEPLEVGQDILTIAVPFLVIATLLFTFSAIEKKVYSFEGALYGLLYLVFIGQLFNFI